jgi:UDP-N-acetylmuramoyl-L-alanyl-D-glutamate--2,6-diaminopimelate ligase
MHLQQWSPEMAFTKAPSYYKYDSRAICPGDVFIVLPGGEHYIDSAVAAGASELLLVSREQFPELSHRLYGNPSRELVVVGVTGTNGKTTVCHLVAECLKKHGKTPYVLGTLNASLTTPESLDIAALMRSHLDNGGTHFIMEVSSHGIAQHRVDGVEFNAKLLTNITQDHLDYHGTMAEYRSVKMRFMTQWSGVSILPEEFHSIELGFQSPLLGEFNHRNMQAVVAILRELHVPKGVMVSALESASAPSGRFEPVDMGQSFTVVVDYAHTSDSLENVLKTAQALAVSSSGRLICVFGCGGDRDRKKRPLMAQAAEKYANFTVVTSDNPRTESQSQITQDIVAGFSPHFKDYHVEEDRASAIHSAIQMAKDNDVVVVAGKGHETYQILPEGTIDFDDREIVREALKRCLT